MGEFRWSEPTLSTVTRTVTGRPKSVTQTVICVSQKWAKRHVAAGRVLRRRFGGALGLGKVQYPGRCLAVPLPSVKAARPPALPLATIVATVMLVSMSALAPAASAAAPTTAAASAAGDNHFFAGYCTWQAAELAHQTWGVWLPWFDDAGDWAAGAEAAGWTVSTSPSVHSIAAMPRFVQGSGAFGHVGWVTEIDPDRAGVTLVSMNWRGRGLVTEHHILADGLVAFITPPEAD